MSGYTSSDLPNWLAQQKAKNAADGIGDNLLAPAPAANRPVGAGRFNDTYAGTPSPSFSPVIGAYGAHPVTAAMRANALDIASAASQFGPADMASIRAFHGSPYDFHAFDTSKIGTGEGAQAYGHGHYAAEAEPTAKTYSVPSKAWLDETNAKLSSLAKEMDKYNTGQYGKFNDPRGYELKAQYEQLLQERADKTGHMYEVSLNADPEHFLDWDKPLSEQSQHVQRYFIDEQGRGGPGITPQTTGAEAHRLISRGQEAEVSASMRDYGIPGIRYLDQGSRSQGQGTSNFVIFDPKTIEILRKYGIAGLMAGGAAAATQAPNSDQ
jgi:hypothetical protein